MRPQRSNSVTFTTRRDAGFTLVEMLVVIAVVALVVGIALPALGRARDSGRRASCLANLRGLAQSTVAYMDSYHALPLTEAVTDRSQGVMTMPRLLDGVDDEAAIPPRFRCASDKDGDQDWSSYAFVPARMIRSTSDDDFYLPTLDNEGLESPASVWRMFEQGQVTEPIWTDRDRFHMSAARREDFVMVPNRVGMNGSFVDGSARILE